jgi:hypothetical protein
MITKLFTAVALAVDSVLFSHGRGANDFVGRGVPSSAECCTTDLFLKTVSVRFADIPHQIQRDPVDQTSQVKANQSDWWGMQTSWVARVGVLTRTRGRESWIR